MRRIIYSVLSIVFVLGLTPSCGNNNDRAELAHHHDHGHHHEGDDHDHEHEGDDHEHEHEHEGEEHEHAHEDADAITIKPATAKRMGVESATIQPGEFYEIIKVSGELQISNDDQSTASATSSGIVTLSPGLQVGSKVSSGQRLATISAKGLTGGDENTVNQTILEATKRELDRLTPLHSEGLVTTKEYNEALKAYQEARAASSGRAAGGAATAPRAGVVTELLVRSGDFVTTGQPVAVIGNSTRLTLKADVPGRYRDILPRITTANFRTVYNDAVYSIEELKGHLVSNSAAASSAGYTPVFFTFNNASGQLHPGSSVEVFLRGAPRGSVLTVPREAIVEQQGTHYAYVQLDEDCYQKRRVKLGPSDGRNVEIKSGLKPGEKVVIKGATVVKLAESSGAVPEGHSHNH